MSGLGKKTKIFLGVIFTLLTVSAHSQERGVASYYAGKFQGRLTANGERFDTNLFTAAHKTLPFNTIVKVLSEDTGKSVLVRINDRGPFVAGRIIDLSRTAAEAIDMVGKGLARVSVEIVARGDGKTFHHSGPPSGKVDLQVGAFGDIQNAEKVRKALENRGIDVSLEPISNGMVRVLIKGVPVGDVDLMKFQLADIGHPGSFVRRVYQ